MSDRQQIGAAVGALRPLLTMLPPSAALAVGPAIGALEALLAEPVIDTQDEVTPRPDVGAAPVTQGTGRRGGTTMTLEEALAAAGKDEGATCDEAMSAGEVIAVQRWGDEMVWVRGCKIGRVIPSMVTAVDWRVVQVPRAAHRWQIMQGSARPDGGGAAVYWKCTLCEETRVTYAPRPTEDMWKR